MSDGQPQDAGAQDAPANAETDGQPEAPAFGDITPEDFANLIATATDEQIAEGMSGPGRELALKEIFNRMAEHVNPEKAKGNDAVIHWKILDRPDGGYDHFEVVLKDGACTVSDQPSQEPRVTFSVPPVEFLKLITMKESGPALFMTGKLKIEGDLMFASQMTSFFRVPTAAQPAAGDQAAGAGQTDGGEAST